MIQVDIKDYRRNSFEEFPTAGGEANAHPVLPLDEMTFPMNMHTYKLDGIISLRILTKTFPAKLPAIFSFNTSIPPRRKTGLINENSEGGYFRGFSNRLHRFPVRARRTSYPFLKMSPAEFSLV